MAASVSTEKKVDTTVTTLLNVRRGAEAIDFYTRAFGAKTLSRIDAEDKSVVAHLSVGKGDFWVADESPAHQNFSPQTLGGSSVRMVIISNDPDKVFAQAIAAGASSVCPVRDESYGWRIGRVLDPFGHHWEIGNAAKAAESIETERLLLRRPRASDAQVIFERFASDREVTRYLSWPTHRSVVDTLAFLSMSDDEWQRWPAGPYLVFARPNGKPGALVGSTGLLYKNRTLAETGYVFAKDAWGQGFATESLQAMVDVASQTGVQRLEAICHAEHAPSARVLEKCGFAREEVRREHFVFPNLKPQKKCDVFSYVRCF